MKKNIVYIAIILMVLAGTMLTLTGCGDSKETKETNKKVEYTEGMMNLRNFDPAVLDGHTTGELLDKSLKNANWKEDEKYSYYDGAAVIVTGKDQKTDKDVKIVWLSSKEDASGFQTMTLGDEELGYSSFLSYLMDYIE
jgi:ABC-type oligopeptide transport system substrate-binding subunit